jgi:hypothetical protein
MSDEIKFDNVTPIGHGHTLRMRRKISDMYKRLTESFFVPKKYIMYGRSWIDDAIMLNMCSCCFKSKECGYAGPETWCDKTSTRCSQLKNLVNFRGSRTRLL